MMQDVLLQATLRRFPQPLTLGLFPYTNWPNT